MEKAMETAIGPWVPLEGFQGHLVFQGLGMENRTNYICEDHKFREY